MLDDAPLKFRPERHVGVVLASQGYPASGPMGLPIAGLDAAARLDNVLVFHAGTARRGDQIVTAGGRVLTVVGRGPTYEEAISRAYAGVATISFDGMHYRRDIGQKALTRS
jgi:phosphoribosylamine--glycine ligase